MKEINFNEKVYEVVSKIPCGKVVTYGQIALILRVPRSARRVGYALHFAPAGVPCHRVVNCVGRLAPGFIQQRKLLESEGIKFTESGHVDLKHFILKPGEITALKLEIK